MGCTASSRRLLTHVRCSWSRRIRSVAFIPNLFVELLSVAPRDCLRRHARTARGSPMPLQQVETLTESQLADLHVLYQNEWWSKGRSLDDVRQMVEGTSLIIGFVN